ncbi:MAG: hypothetical protein IKJ65_03165 [Clostridia bacterium]|nr:hypothetical protein [Clostridia bacterium]
MIRSFCQKIDFPAEAIDCMEKAYSVLKNNAAGLEWAQTCINAVTENRTENLVEMLEKLAQITGLHRYTSDMLFWVLCAQPLKARYAENQLTEEMYWDAMHDLKYKLMECYKFCGIWGSFTSGSWFAYFHTLKRLAFGRLQYDPWEWPYAPYKGKIQPGDNVYRIHIPAAGPLTKESVLDSFRKLYAFFRKDYPDGVMPIVCRSWLLYPAHVSQFGENSNTATFAGMFDLLETQEDPNFSSFRWMFNLKYEGPETLKRVPTDTRFQRSAKAYFEAGNLPGIGCGVLLFDGEKVLE